jgi:hypothetical protein
MEAVMKEIARGLFKERKKITLRFFRALILF